MKIKKISKQKYSGKVHNIECKPNHTFIYKKCVVHNCGAGDYFVKSLTSDQIVEQVKHCMVHTGVGYKDINKLQIMFMSMGEPFLNMKHTCDAIESLNKMYPRAQLLVSTIGPDVNYRPFISTAQMISKVGLQLSIHKSTDEERNKLIPFAKKRTLKELGVIGSSFKFFTGRKPFINYCADESNTSDEDALRLKALFDPSIFECTISVVCERNDGLPIKEDKQKRLALEFSEKMLNLGYNVRVFDPAGQNDIGGGCGQLFHVQKWMKENPDKARPSCGNGLPVIHSPK